MTMRLSPILKYQLAIDIHVISTVGGAAVATVLQAAKARAAEARTRRFIEDSGHAGKAAYCSRPRLPPGLVPRPVDATAATPRCAARRRARPSARRCAPARAGPCATIRRPCAGARAPP